MTENWVNMDTATQQARQRKAYNIRLCRHYLRRALGTLELSELEKSLPVLKLSEKSTTVRKWRYMLAEARTEPVWQIAEQLQKEA